MALKVRQTNNTAEINGWLSLATEPESESLQSSDGKKTVVVRKPISANPGLKVN